MREKLIKLLREADKICDSQKNGVVALPCEIDAPVFIIPTKENGRKEITPMTCLGFLISKSGNMAYCFDEKYKLYQSSFDMFGKTVFLTYKEAKEALTKGSQ